MWKKYIDSELPISELIVMNGSTGLGIEKGHLLLWKMSFLFCYLLPIMQQAFFWNWSFGFVFYLLVTPDFNIANHIQLGICRWSK